MAKQEPVSREELLTKAKDAEQIGAYGLARSFYNDAFRTLRDPTDGHIAAQITRWIGTAYLNEGDTAAAQDVYEASLAIAQALNDELNEAYAENSFGGLYLQTGELDRAEASYRRAATLAKVIGEVRLQAMTNQNRGVIANIRGDLGNALSYYKSSLEAYRELKEEKFLAQLLNNLGMIHTDLEQWDDAVASFGESAEICRRLGDTQTQVLVEVNLAELNVLRGDLSRAREHCDSAFEICTSCDYQLGLGEVYKWYGVIYRHTSKFNLAEAHLRSACEIAERFSSPLLAGEVQRDLAEVYRALDRNRDALLALNYSHRVFNDLRAELDLADIDRRMHDLERVFLEVVRKWGESIESKDRYTAGHCERVADYSTMLARAVGFDEQTIVWFRMGAFLHDVGKTAIPAEILNKEGQLSQEEWGLMKQHTIKGVEMLSSIDFPWDVRPMVRSHHERWDGMGYPDGLAGRAIPLSARILCVADVFDALTTTRSYREAHTTEAAFSIMSDDAGRIFDAELLSLFIAQIRERDESTALLLT